MDDLELNLMTKVPTRPINGRSLYGDPNITEMENNVDFSSRTSSSPFVPTRHQIPDGGDLVSGSSTRTREVWDGLDPGLRFDSSSSRPKRMPSQQIRPPVETNAFSDPHTGIVQKLPIIGHKHVVFHFLASGIDTSEAIRKSNAVRDKNPPGHVIKNSEIEKMDRFDIGEIGVSDYMFVSVPKLVGVEFAHVEVEFRDAEFVDDDGNKQIVDYSFSSYASTKGPKMTIGKNFLKSKYPVSWNVEVSAKLFNSALEHMLGLVSDGDKTYGYFDLACLPFFGVPCFQPLRKLFGSSDDKLYSCSRIAAEAILSLKLGDRAFYTALHSQSDVSPDMIFCILARFYFVNAHYPNSVRQERIRGSASGRLVDIQETLALKSGDYLRDTRVSGRPTQQHVNLDTLAYENTEDDLTLIEKLTEEIEESEDRTHDMLTESQSGSGNYEQKILDEEKKRKELIKRKQDLTLKTTMVNIRRVNAADWKECTAKESEKDYLYIISDNITPGPLPKALDHKISNIPSLGLKKECYTISSLVHSFTLIGSDYFSTLS